MMMYDNTWDVINELVNCRSSCESHPAAMRGATLRECITGRLGGQSDPPPPLPLHPLSLSRARARALSLHLSLSRSLIPYTARFRRSGPLQGALKDLRNMYSWCEDMSARAYAYTHTSSSSSSSSSSSTTARAREGRAPRCGAWTPRQKASWRPDHVPLAS